MNISNYFFDQAAKNPDKSAIIHGNNSITYGELAAEVKKTAQYIYGKGIRKNDRVLVFIPMGIDLYRIVLAIFSVGATAVFIDEWTDKSALLKACKTAKCKAMITGLKVRFFSMFYHETRSIPIKLLISGRAKNLMDPISVDKDDSALITFTTGSTGLPKAADRSHGFLSLQLEIIGNEMNNSGYDVAMVNLPVVLFSNLAQGISSVIPLYNSIQPDRSDWNAIAAQLNIHKVTQITGSPYFLSGIADHFRKKDQTVSGITKIFTGGGPVFPDQARMLLFVFTSARIKVVYGSTEAEPISLIDAENLLELYTMEQKGLPAGVPHPSLNVKIVRMTEKIEQKMKSDKFEQMKVKEEEIGEILISGSPVLDRYFPAEKNLPTNKVQVNEVLWHRTGDSGYIKNDILYLTGRVQEIIKRENKYYAPFIEELKINAHPFVKNGCIIQSENKIVLFIQLEKGCIISEKLFDFPFDELRIIDEFPRDPRHHTKIDYRALRKLI
ncbi:MAG: AMP-binding protein [Brumimicrobium sp.]|nr:AMP-binding protein [Brumimicrobium sp.]